MKKQVFGKKDDTPLHLAARRGDLEEFEKIISATRQDELKAVLCKPNHYGEIALYVAAENGCVALVVRMIKYYDVGSARIKANNGLDAFEIAAKMGESEVMKVLLEAYPLLITTADKSLHIAAAQGNVKVIDFLLESNDRLAAATRNNGKTALHSCARNGHIEAVKSILGKQPSVALRRDKKGQTPLHMAAKGTSARVVEELIESEESLLMTVDGKGNTPLHVAARKGRLEIVQTLLKHKKLNKEAINKLGETAYDAAERADQQEIVHVLKENNVKSVKFMTQSEDHQQPASATELNKTVIDIKHDVDDQIEHNRQTRIHVRGIAKRLNRMKFGGLNNTMTSTTMVAALIATGAFSAIAFLPGQYQDNGQATISPSNEFTVFYVSNSLALFISMAVVVVQISVVVVENKAKKQLTAVINKLLWFACASLSVAFVSICYVDSGTGEKKFSNAIAVVAAAIMATTIGTMCYWVIKNRVDASRRQTSRRSRNLQSSAVWDSDDEEDDAEEVYAL